MVVGGFNGVVGLLGLVWLVLGLGTTGGKDTVAGVIFIVVAGVNLALWYRLRQPLVVVEDDAVFWRSGFGMRRHALDDLALAPDPFDLSVLRLQTRGQVRPLAPRWRGQRPRVGAAARGSPRTVLAVDSQTTRVRCTTVEWLAGTTSGKSPADYLQCLTSGSGKGNLITSDR